jgi:beta-lactamase class A
MTRTHFRLGFYSILTITLIIWALLKIFPDHRALLSAFNLSMPQSYNYQDAYLKRIIDARLKDQAGDFAIVIESLDGDQLDRYYLNEDKSMPSASLYKLVLMAAALKQEEGGQLKGDQVLSAPVTHLNEVLGGPEFGFEDATGDISYTVDECLARIARLSDNYAAILLAEKMGWETVQAEADDMGMKHTSIQDPISTTASDISLFFEKLYKKQIVSIQTSDKLIALLETSQINDRIPAKLPQGLKIAHKTGELSGVRNDAGIVFLDGNPYIIVLMSQNLQYEDDGVELLANISKDVYDYFLDKD